MLGCVGSLIYRSLHGSDALHHLVKIDLKILRVDAESVCAPNGLRRVGGIQKGFAGDAAGPRTIAAQAVALDERGAGPEVGRHAGSRQAGRSATSDGQVETGRHIAWLVIRTSPSVCV